MHYPPHRIRGHRYDARRFLEEKVREVDPEYQDFDKLGDYSTAPSVDGTNKELIIWVVTIISICIVLVAIVFYISYRQEYCCGYHKKEDEHDGKEREKECGDRLVVLGY